jgi:hypothetical protein
VSEIFYNFFINVAKDIGSSNIKSDESHPSISQIIANTPDIENLVYHDIKEDFIIKQINKINTKKATGRDGVSAKILKIAKPVIAKPISELVNTSISLGKFPEKLKEAQVVPCYKKSNALDKSNYRPVSILPVISKFFERAINDQLVFYFSKIVHPYLSAFRSGYGCQTAL